MQKSHTSLFANRFSPWRRIHSYSADSEFFITVETSTFYSGFALFCLKILFCTYFKIFPPYFCNFFLVSSSKTMLSQPALFSVLNINVETKKHILINKEAQVCLADSKFFKVLPEFLNHYPCIIYTMLSCANTEPGPQRRDVSWFKTIYFHSRGHKLFIQFFLIFSNQQNVQEK